MRQIGSPVQVDELSGAWCDASDVTSSLMEAISFLTPLLENFFICTVAETLAGQQDASLEQRCRAFIREEAAHSRDHRKFNVRLLRYLGVNPPGLAMIQALLNAARARLSLSRRLLLVATLEHFAAVLSKFYLNQEAQWDFRCAFARELFARHAREELGHRSVVFDLCLSRGNIGRVQRALIIWAILLAALVYVSAAVPWILHRKTGKRLMGVLSAFAGFVMTCRPVMMIDSPLRELFLFARVDYHPEWLVANGADAGVKRTVPTIIKEPS